jgi:hypothetical protein
MSLQVYLAFVAACIALALLPGPVVTLMIANGLRYGTRAALTNILGVQAGLAIVIGIVAVGLTSLMATMGYWFGSASSSFVFRSKASRPTSRHRRRAAGFSCKAFSWRFPIPKCWCSSARSFHSSWT